MMSRRRKAWVAGLLLVLSLTAIELGVWMTRKPRAAVMLVNGGDATLRNIRVSYAGAQVPVGDLKSGASTMIRVEAGPGEDVDISFLQEGNPSPGVLIGADELSAIRRDGLVMILTLKPNEVIRYQEEDPNPDSSLLSRLWSRALDAILSPSPRQPAPAGPRTLRSILGVGLPDVSPRVILSVPKIA